MSNKANNLAIVDQIKTLLGGIKLDGDAGHDAIMFVYTDRQDHDSEPDDLTVQGTVQGCACTWHIPWMIWQDITRPCAMPMPPAKRYTTRFSIFWADWAPWLSA